MGQMIQEDTEVRAGQSSARPSDLAGSFRGQRSQEPVQAGAVLLLQSTLIPLSLWP